MSSKYEFYVKALLEFRDELEEKKYLGLWHLPDELADLDEAIELAELTIKQREVIDLLYVKYFDGVEVAEKLGVEPSTVTRHAQAAVRKIANIYEQWEALEHVN
ncbi:sigma factor-like helix-turn-helix DNA-binding protein [Bacillus sp. 7894-2]|uniref:sigma factor-like helix-turn-helix DNA-binding protein n=1 Tax=Bacillus sp. 7894-2 TaxID=2021695 RepID=UPI000BA6E306|nr:sigma factor-like helix-turn-helix DNA-binding protein [Bacillus sp. 7894-2]PAE24050.1 hypothetical protein CHI10_14700 [Bacillus sp. 7894-2]